AAHAGDGERGAEVRILARALDDASPARIACDVHHGGEGPVHTGRRRFGGSYPCIALCDVGIPARGLAERDGELRAVAVNDVEPEDERDVESALLDRDALDAMRGLGADDVEDRADASRSNGVEGGV